MDELNKLEDNIMDALEKNPQYLLNYGLDSKEITDLFNQRKEELVKSPIFGSLKKGSTVLMKDGTRMYVETKTRDGIPLVKKPGKDALMKMKESDLNNIERIIQPGEVIPEVIIAPTTKEDIEVSVENLKNQREFLSDPDARATANKEANTKSDKEASDDLLNSICK